MDGTAQEAWVDLRPVHRDYPTERIPTCDEPSPTGRMLCILPKTDLGHSMAQHLGIDRRGNFRGWPDGRCA